jgi:hypothetical protein
MIMARSTLKTRFGQLSLRLAARCELDSGLLKNGEGFTD